MGYFSGSRSTIAMVLNDGTENSVALPGFSTSFSTASGGAPYAASFVGR